MPDAIVATDEYFLDEYAIQNVIGLTRSINRPAFSPLNNFFGSDAYTWDRDIAWPAMFGAAPGGGYHLYYQSFDVASRPYFCVAYSADGVTFVKPDLQLYSYFGNIHNNILAAHDIEGTYYDPNNSPPYVAIGSTLGEGSSNFGVHLWSSTDGLHFTLVQTLFTSTLDDYLEAKSIWQRADGRWLVYYMKTSVQAPLTQRREQGMLISDTSNIAGTWSNKGVVLDCRTTPNKQWYHSYVFRLGSVYLLFLGVYNKAAESIHGALAVSRDGIYPWTVLDENWVPLGPPGAWDDKMTTLCAGLHTFGDVWRIYYTGYAEDHAHGPPAGGRLGFVYLRRGGIAQISGTGTLLTKLIAVPSGKKLYINHNGALTVACYDGNGIPLTGYYDHNCTAISGDEYDREVTWGALSAPNNQNVQFRFTLSGGTLYNYRFDT